MNPKKNLLDSLVVPSAQGRKRNFLMESPSAPVEVAEQKPARIHKYKVYSHKPSGRGVFTTSKHFDVHYLNSSKPLEDFAKGLAERGFLVKTHKGVAGGIGNYWVMPGAITRVEQIG